MTKFLRENPDCQAAHKKVMDYLDTKENQASTWATQIATAKMLGDFILKNHQLEKLPPEIRYFLALTWNFYASVFCPEKLVGKLDADFQDYFESGGIDDRFAMVVKQLYDICKEEKLL